MAVSRKTPIYFIYALVSAISFRNVQLIVISLLAINVSGWKLAEALTLCISANSVESCNSEVQSCLSDKKALKGYFNLGHFLKGHLRLRLLSPGTKLQFDIEQTRKQRD